MRGANYLGSLSYTGVEKSEIDYICAGTNHMGWFIKLESHGKGSVSQAGGI